MVRIALAVVVAAAFAVTPSVSKLAAKAKQASATHMTAVQLQKPAPRCLAACPRYGWPSYLLSFPPPRWQ
jgi:hypothetical protein